MTSKRNAGIIFSSISRNMLSDINVVHNIVLLYLTMDNFLIQYIVYIHESMQSMSYTFNNNLI